MLKVLAYTGGRNLPGARFRVRQYIPALAELGIEVTESPATFCSYPPEHKILRPFWGVAHLLKRGYDVASDRDSDVVLLQREMLSSFFTWERFTRRPRVLDVDDAIWLYRGGHFARRLAQCSDAIICGNSYIADWFRQWCDRVRIVPTPVDTSRFRPIASPPRGRVVIGWSGTRGGFVYFKELAAAVAEVLQKVPGAVFRIISDASPSLPHIPAERIEFIPWSQATEATALQDMTLGLMPLDNSEWSLGKCSYKMLLYMACGVPVVVTPIGMNVEVLRRGQVGYGAATHKEWVDAMMAIIEAEPLRGSMGQEGRRVVLEHYSLSRWIPAMAAALKDVAANHSALTAIAAQPQAR